MSKNHHIISGLANYYCFPATNGNNTEINLNAELAENLKNLNVYFDENVAYLKVKFPNTIQALYLNNTLHLYSDLNSNSSNLITSLSKQGSISGQEYLLEFLSILINQIKKFVKTMSSTIVDIEGNNEERINQIFEFKTQLQPAARALFKVNEFLEQGLEGEIFCEHESRVHSLVHETELLKHDFENINNNLSDLLNIEQNITNLNMNRIMKTLTVVSVFFVPLTFLTSLYGMNFVNIPELSHPHGYFIFLGALAFISLWLFYLIKRKGW